MWRVRRAGWSRPRDFVGGITMVVHLSRIAPAEGLPRLDIVAVDEPSAVPEVMCPRDGERTAPRPPPPGVMVGEGLTVLLRPGAVAGITRYETGADSIVTVVHYRTGHAGGGFGGGASCAHRRAGGDGRLRADEPSWPRRSRDGAPGDQALLHGPLPAGPARDRPCAPERRSGLRRHGRTAAGFRRLAGRAYPSDTPAAIAPPPRRRRRAGREAGTLQEGRAWMGRG